MIYEFVTQSMSLQVHLYAAHCVSPEFVWTFPYSFIACHVFASRTEVCVLESNKIVFSIQATQKLLFIGNNQFSVHDLILFPIMCTPELSVETVTIESNIVICMNGATRAIVSLSSPKPPMRISLEKPNMCENGRIIVPEFNSISNRTRKLDLLNHALAVARLFFY